MMYLCQFGGNRAIGEEDGVQTCLFYMSLVTLYIRSRSPKSYNSFWLSQISICASFDLIHLAVNMVERRQKATSQHRYWNHLIFHNFDRTVSVKW